MVKLIEIRLNINLPNKLLASGKKSINKFFFTHILLQNKVIGTYTYDKLKHTIGTVLIVNQ